VKILNICDSIRLKKQLHRKRKVTNEDAKSIDEKQNVSDFTIYRLQKLIDEAESMELVLTYAEILYGYEGGDWGVDWIGGMPIPVGTDIEFWDKDLNPIVE
jgi:hypothetical protein